MRDLGVRPVPQVLRIRPDPTTYSPGTWPVRWHAPSGDRPACHAGSGRTQDLTVAKTEVPEVITSEAASLGTLAAYGDPNRDTASSVE